MDESHTDDTSMDTLNSLFNWYTQTMKTNPAMATLMSMYGLALVTMAFRSVPMRIFNFLRRQFTTTLMFNNSTIGTSADSFNGFLRWFENSRWSKWSRSLSLNGSYTERCEGKEHGTVVGIGDGSHFFFYRGRPVWMYRRRLEQTGNSYQVNYEISLTMLGRRRDLILAMIDEFRYRPDPSDISIYTYGTDGWVRMGNVSRRRIETVITGNGVKEELVQAIDRFRTNREWYFERGVAYKLTIMLTGVPGTGKTSLIKALASHYNMNIAILNLSEMDDNSLKKALANAPENTIIAMEDFDSCEAVWARSHVMTMPSLIPKPSETTGDAPEKSGATALFKQLTLSGVLQALDGLVPLDNRLLFLTTNNPGILDPAVTRRGRVNRIFEVTPLADADVRAYSKLKFPEYEIAQAPVPFAPIAGCDLEALWYDHHDSPESFVAAIPKVA